MNKYLITLTPTGKFFFGGDMTFETKTTDPEAKKYDENYSSYIIHSATMPQQTSLLGMLRFLILSNDATAFSTAENRIINKEKANKLIGAKSFLVDDREASFGKIDQIGPCFLYDTENTVAYFRYGKDSYLCASTHTDTTIEASFNNFPISIPLFQVKERLEAKKPSPLFTGKDDFGAQYISENGDTAYPEIDGDKGMFIEDTRIGIDKDYKGRPNKSAFYKQISYRLKKNFAFAFTAQLNITDEEMARYNKQVVTLGADSSCFVLQIEQIDDNKEYRPQNIEKGKVLLLSDAYLPKLPECVTFTITNIKPFRFLHIENSEKSSDYNVKYKSSRSAKRYDLYQAGSVFYVTDKEAFQKALQEKQEFTKIGYNQSI